MVKDFFILIVSASYWRYRRQRESHAVSLFWAALVLSFPFTMWVLSLARWLVQTSEHLQTVQVVLAHLLPFLVPGLWLVGWCLLYRFVQVNPVVYTEELPPEIYRQGNLYAFLFLAVGIGTTIYTFLTLGSF